MPAPLLGKRTVTFDTEIKWTPITATLVVWGTKAIVGRARPALWEAQWYWGSSFPSGHTLSTAAFATAAALCVARIWPRAGSVAMALAALWT
ncbi:MAG TPA: hypothetical protein PKV17_16650, partial [Aquabacterium sp.]|nr:hypothetical protein [Aquabacterium sp.]